MKRLSKINEDVLTDIIIRDRKSMVRKEDIPHPEKIYELHEIIRNAFIDQTGKNCIDLTHIDVSNLKELTYLLINVPSFRMKNVSSIDVTGWNVSGVEDFSDCFYELGDNIKKIKGLETWDVSSAINMQNMFNKCTGLTTISGVMNWNVSKVKNMGNMFSRCESLYDFSPLKNWKTSSVIYMAGMFDSSKIYDLSPLKNWDVSGVEDMTFMFADCDWIKSLKPLKNWNVTSVEKMKLMFYKCTGIKNLEGLKDWDVKNISETCSMFEGCVELTDIEDVRNWNLKNSCDVYHMFFDCGKIDKTVIDNWKTYRVRKKNIFS